MKEERSIIVIGDLPERSLPLPEKAAKIKVTDQASLEKANRFIGFCKDIMDEVDGLFDLHIKRALDLKRGLEADKRKYWEPPSFARATVRAEISRYALEQSEILRKAEEAKRLAEHKAWMATQDGKPKQAEKILAKIEPLPPTPKALGLSFRDDWKFEIEDASKLPREYLMPDEVKIGKDVRDYKGGCVDRMKSIGVRVFMVKTPIQR